MPRGGWAGLAVLAASLGVLGWWWLRPITDPAGTSATAENASTLTADPAAAARPVAVGSEPEALPAAGPDWTFQTLLLPAADSAADPASVRVGIARVSAEDAAAFRDWQSGPAEGAGPTTLAELAQVEEWWGASALPVEAGAVRVGPLPLPAAERYELQARGTEPLQYYRATFTREDAPANVEPLQAAGLTIRMTGGDLPAAGVQILLRRVDDLSAADAPLWQELLAQEAPALLAAYGDSAVPLPPDGRLAPLPPGPVQVIVQVAGVAAAQARLELVAGRYTELSVDPIALGVAAALTTRLELTVAAESDGTGIADVRVVWSGNGAVGPEQWVTTDGDGMARFAGVERLRTQHFALEFPLAPDTGLPRWPARHEVTLTLDALPPSAPQTGVTRQTVTVPGLRWLLLDPAPLPLNQDRRGGQPYPVFVLQLQAENDPWREQSADHFLVRPEGLAVSVTGTGRFRVLAFASPWQLLTSTEADLSRATPGDRHRVRLPAVSGRPVQLELRQLGRPLGHATVAVLGTARGLPPVTLTADAQGRLRLADVTVPTLVLEVAGQGQVQVDLDGPTVVVEVPPAS